MSISNEEILVRSYAVKLLIFFMILTYTSAGFGKEKLNLDNFNFQGEALIEVTIFKIDVYVAKYYVKKGSPESVLELQYKIDVEKKHSLKGWKEGFKPLDKNLYKKAIKWVYDNTHEMKSGDSFAIWKNKDSVRFYHNKNLIAEVKDKQISYIVTYPWLGEKPLDNDIKNKLLGK